MSLLFGLVWLVAGQTAGWGFRLEWEHSGAATHFQLCYSAGCTTLAAELRNPAAGTWSAPLPLLPAGVHQLTVSACNSELCTPSTQTLWVNVVANRASVVDGPNAVPPTDPNQRPAPQRRPPRD